MNIKLWLRNIFVLFALLSCTYAQNWALWLEDVKILANTDTFGDQIYFFLLQKNDGQAVYYASLPDFPFSYTAENLANFQPGILWKGDMTPKNNISIVVSLVDREALPWIADEVLGNIEIMIASQDQGLAIQWTSLTPSVTFDPNQTSPLAQRVHVEQNGGKYSFDLSWKCVENVT
jgi:hypothetical protein